MNKMSDNRCYAMQVNAFLALTSLSGVVASRTEEWEDIFNEILIFIPTIFFDHFYHFGNYDMQIVCTLTRRVIFYL